MVIWPGHYAAPILSSCTHLNFLLSMTHHSNGFQWYFRTTRCYNSEPVYSSLQTELPIIVSTAYGIHLLEKWFSHNLLSVMTFLPLFIFCLIFVFFKGVPIYIIVFWSKELSFLSSQLILEFESNCSIYQKLSWNSNLVAALRRLVSVSP